MESVQQCRGTNNPISINSLYSTLCNVMYCNVVYYTVQLYSLYCAGLACAVLHSLYCIVLYYLYCTVLYCTVLYWGGDRGEERVGRRRRMERGKRGWRGGGLFQRAS